jgi:ferredoxin
MGIASLASPLRITRTPAACIDCGKCARVCPSHLAVDQLVQIRSSECLGCLDCVAACPVEGALDLAAPGRQVMKPAWIAAALAVLFFGAYGTARYLGYWESPIPDAQYRELIQRASDLAHP